MQELTRHNPMKVIDLLTARLAFERAGVRLYDSIISKMQDFEEVDARRILETLQEHRNEEQEHGEWLEAQIRALGGDTDATTDMAELESRESKGIEEIILDGDNDAMHLFHALLTAELADNAGWDLLVELADEAGDRDAKRAFKKCLHEEEEHLVFVRRIVERLARRVVLEENVETPTP